MTISYTSALETFEAECVRPQPGRVLIVGSHVYPGKTDRHSKHKDALGVDMIAGEGVDVVLNLEDELPADLGTFAHIECMSVLEHTPRPWVMAANLERLLKVGGSIYVAVPFIWRVHAYPSDYWRFTIEAVRVIFPRISWTHMSYAHRSVSAHPKTPKLMHNGMPYFARTETCAFGFRT